MYIKKVGGLVRVLCHIGVGLALTLGCCGLHARGVYAAIAFSDVIVRSFEGRIFFSVMKRTSPRACGAGGKGTPVPVRVVKRGRALYDDADDFSFEGSDGDDERNDDDELTDDDMHEGPPGKKPATGSAVDNDRAALNVTDNFAGYVNDKNPTNKKVQLSQKWVTSSWLYQSLGEISPKPTVDITCTLISESRESELIR